MPSPITTFAAQYNDDSTTFRSIAYNRRIECWDHIARSLPKQLIAANEAMHCDHKNRRGLILQKKSIPFRADNVLRIHFQEMDQLFRENKLIFQFENLQIGPFKCGYCHFQGDRITLEDEHIACQTTLEIQHQKYDAQIFGILDGHNGNETANHVKNHFCTQFQIQIDNLGQRFPDGPIDPIIWNALKRTFVTLNDQIRDNSGTAASIALIIDSQLWVAHSGDTRIFIDESGDRITALTEDMKPAQCNDREEQIWPITLNDTRYFTHFTRRILKRGGIIAKKSHDVFRISGSTGNLALAGAIGDIYIHGISARPVITRVPIHKLTNETYLYLVCDGVTDVVSSVELANAIRSYGARDCANMASITVISAYNAGSTDNISAMVVCLKMPMPQQNSDDTLPT
ncbi:MAG: putative protein phosphatase 13 [Parachlamydiales bacterium]|nr:putative protein phosphatase 13 [Parachlamydiales bacterium]